MQAVKKNNKCFVVWSKNLDNRLDPYYHKTEFAEIISKIKKGEFKTKTIGELSELVKSGSTPKASLKCFTEIDGILFIRNTDLKENVIRYGSAKKIKREFEKNLKGLLLKKGDVLISMAGTIGVSTIYDTSDLATINQNITLIRFNKEINPQYAVIWLNTYYFKRLIDRVATIATIKYVNNEVIKKLPIPVPPLETQNKIVKLMQSAYDKKIDKEQKAENILNSVGSYILKELDIKIENLKNKNCFCINSKEVEGKRLDPKGYLDTPQTILKAIKKSAYKTKTLSELLETSIAGEWGEDATLENNEGYSLIKVLRNTNFDNQGNLNFSVVAERFIENNKLAKVELKNGDILIEKSGGSPIQPVGRVALIENLKDRFTFSNFLQCFRVKKECIPEYLFCFLKTLYGLNYMEYLQNQTTGIKNLIMEEYLSIPVPLPPIDTQKKLANEFRDRLESATKLKLEAKNEIEKAKQEVESIILGK
ncbi:MAG: restriction endonuclease subunit S [Candidatus Staskawiczbacteria bacterium]|nr:restriction endonuclease subunit S [Candidatus Staskawiczbacteria bacterium]